MTAKFTKDLGERLLDEREALVLDLKHHLTKGLLYDTTIDEFTVSYRMEELAKIYSNFEINKREISIFSSKLFQKQELDEFHTSNHDLADEFVECKSHLTKLLPTPIRDELNRSTHNTLNPELKYKPKLNLPAISMKKFSGNISEWEEFRDTFQAFFNDSEQKMPNCQKLLYLKSFLEGEAFNLLKSLSSNNENYNAAWEILNKRYHNVRRIFEAHFNAILDSLR